MTNDFSVPHPFAVSAKGWDTTRHGCPTLAAFLFLRLGWDTTNFPQCERLYFT
jgi:hypothetical protein